VAARLIEENRIRYVPKTVGSRWLRLRKALEAAEDERLDDELSDWHVGEVSGVFSCSMMMSDPRLTEKQDELLHESIKLIDEKLEVEFEKLKERKWREVSINFAARLEKEMKIYGKKYTAKACKERMEGLQDGTASLPIELDPDQEGRKKTSEARIAAAKKARRERVAEQQRAEDEKTTRLEKKKVDDAEKERKRIAETHERAAEKAAEARMKKDRKQAVTDQKAKKQAVLAQIKAQEEWLKTKARVEREILARLSGKPPPRVRHSRRRRSGRDSTAEGDEDDGDQADGSDNDDDEPAVDFEEDEEQGQLGDISDYLANTVASPASGPASAVDAPKAAGKAEVTKETLLNPRSILTDSELDVLLFERKLARRSVRETHPEVVARLAAADEAISAPELVDRLRTDFLKTNGNREAKIRRLRESDAGKSAAGAAGVTATDLEFRKGYEGYSGVHSSLLGDE